VKLSRNSRCVSLPPCGLRREGNAEGQIRDEFEAKCSHRDMAVRVITHCCFADASVMLRLSRMPVRSIE
jgi:hypothetical protein